MNLGTLHPLTCILSPNLGERRFFGAPRPFGERAGVRGNLATKATSCPIEDVKQGMGREKGARRK